MNTLPILLHSPEAVQSPKVCLELDIPLHVYTDSESQVALLVGTLLNDIAGVDHEVSHADILEALAITTAVRVAMADTKAGSGFSLELLAVTVHSAQESASRAA
jgi:hypothetical protein